MAFADVAGGVPRGRFRMGDALQGAFDSVFGNFGTFALLALAIYAVPNFVVNAAFGPPAQRISNPGLSAAAGAVNLLVSLATSALLQGALVRGTIAHLNGERPTFEGCARAGLAAAAPLVGVGLLAGLGIMFGFVLLIVPGLFLIALWGVVAPVMVMEPGKGVFGAFGRSADLTAGHRWAVLGTLIVMGILALVVTFVGSAAAGLIGGLGLLFGGGVGVVGGWPGFILITLVTAVGTAFGAIFSNAAPPALYYALRRAKEGAAPAELAKVFD